MNSPSQTGRLAKYMNECLKRSHKGIVEVDSFLPDSANDQPLNFWGLYIFSKHIEFQLVFHAPPWRSEVAPPVGLGLRVLLGSWRELYRDSSKHTEI